MSVVAVAASSVGAQKAVSTNYGGQAGSLRAGTTTSSLRVYADIALLYLQLLA